MKLNSQTIVKEILAYINRCSGKYFSNYYAGITNNVDERLFNQHNLNANDCWIWREAINIENARKAEQELLKLGMKGGAGGGDDSSVFIYCYLITSYTEQR